jgi:hypothetical protein
MHMRWHKEGMHENDGVMGHPSDSEACEKPSGQFLDLIVMSH